MGFPPPPDAPDVPTQVSIGISASFEPTTPGLLAMCGFKIPGFGFNLTFTFQLPPFQFPPLFFFALALKCDLANPIEAEVGFGGGRIGTSGLNADPEFG